MSYAFFDGRYTLKNKVFYRTLQKCSPGCTESKKQVFSFTKPLKDLSLGTLSEPSNAKPFLSSVEQKKVLQEIYETMRVSHQTLGFSMKL
jgi:hypothetical protein